MYIILYFRARFQISVKTVFFFFSLFVLICYTCSMHNVKARLRTYEQRWTKILLWGLIMYNNPLFFLEYVAPKNAFGWIDTIFQTSFLALLLLFWLVMFDGLTKGK